ncbi:MAG: hypothetical protein JOZ72_16580 [Alphaproteobacteria bacterium]|nr:hypothetical protein [Alphaproteobacteria bacterium]
MVSTKVILLVTVLAAPAAAQDSATPLSPLDEPIGQIASTQDGCAVLDKDFPGLREHPMYFSIKHMTLNQIAAMSSGKITPAMMTQAQSDLSALPKADIAATPIAATPASAEAQPEP